MAGETGHVAVTMREPLVVLWDIAPRLVVRLNRLGVARSPIIVGLAFGDRIDGLRDAPPATGLDQGVLHAVAVVKLNLFAVLVLSLAITFDDLEGGDFRAVLIARADPAQVAPHERLFVLLAAAAITAHGFCGCRAGSEERRLLADRPMTVYAADLDSGARLVVEVRVAVRVLSKMAVGAVHALLQMYVLKMDRLFEPVWIVWRNRLVLGVEQVAFAIALEDGAEDPAVPVKVCELRAPERAVERGRA